MRANVLVAVSCTKWVAGSLVCLNGRNKRSGRRPDRRDLLGTLSVDESDTVNELTLFT